MRLKSLGQKGIKNFRVQVFATKCHTQNMQCTCPVCVAHYSKLFYQKCCHFKYTPNAPFLQLKVIKS